MKPLSVVLKKDKKLIKGCTVFHVKWLRRVSALQWTWRLERGLRLLRTWVLRRLLVSGVRWRAGELRKRREGVGCGSGHRR